MASSTKKKKPQNPLLWVVDSIMEEPSYVDRAWFGCRAIYLYGRLMLVLCSGEEPWNGLLIPIGHQLHDGIRKDFKTVKQHPVLKKWLYLAEASEDFETVAFDIVEVIRMNDERFGIEPKERRRRKTS
ncbi:MAG TPA: hypothetical protein VJ508_08565 [Saprospiraceae bacterium]|nr:hypothetical protein [Saprospiraceae bacterium]